MSAAILCLLFVVLIIIIKIYCTKNWAVVLCASETSSVTLGEEHIEGCTGIEHRRR
jgi:hypothetical protein